MNPTPAQALVERLFFKHESHVEEATRLISIRLPEETVVFAQAVAHQSGTSRSAILIEFLTLGRDLFLAELPESLRAKVEGEAVAIYTGHAVSED